MPIAEIARVMGISRNTVKAASEAAHTAPERAFCRSLPASG